MPAADAGDYPLRRNRIQRAHAGCVDMRNPGAAAAVVFPVVATCFLGLSGAVDAESRGTPVHRQYLKPP